MTIDVEEVRSQTFRNDCQISRSQPQNLEADCHLTSTTSKGLSENFNKMSWDNPVTPIDAKNSIGFFCPIWMQCMVQSPSQFSCDNDLFLSNTPCASQSSI